MRDVNEMFERYRRESDDVGSEASAVLDQGLFAMNKVIIIFASSLIVSLLSPLFL